MLPAESTTRKGASGRIHLFEYPAGPDSSSLPVWVGWGSGEEDDASDAQPEESKTPASEHRLSADVEQRLAEESRRSFAAGCEQGRQMEREAQAAGRVEAERERARQGAELVKRFAQEWDRTLQAVEREVVKLALAVAARILRREAQMDPLLLSGAVRVALGQLAGATEVRLRVPPGEVDLWKEAIALVPNLAVKPVVLSGEGMRLGECEIETAMGSVDLGIRAQLSEIERGFFDRAGRSGSGTSTTPASPGEAAVEGTAAGRESQG
ncbi:MAG: FliH/SctL family protein [Terracidiphilus sp.]